MSETTLPAVEGPVFSDRLGVRFPAGDRPAHYPGGMECFDCGCIFIGAVDHKRCRVCEEAAQQTCSETAQRLGYM